MSLKFFVKLLRIVAAILTAAAQIIVAVMAW
jgi:hypothetical protein